VTAIIACAILLALGLLVIRLSTGDLQVSARAVSDKKALAAAESGIHRLIRGYDPSAGNAITSGTFNAIQHSDGLWYLQADPDTDSTSMYHHGDPVTPPTGHPFLPMTGYSIGGGQSWGQQRLKVTVIGRSTGHDAKAEIEIGLGFGPVDISTISR